MLSLDCIETKKKHKKSGGILQILRLQCSFTLELLCPNILFLSSYIIKIIKIENSNYCLTLIPPESGWSCLYFWQNTLSERHEMICLEKWRQQIWSQHDTLLSANGTHKQIHSITQCVIHDLCGLNTESCCDYVVVFNFRYTVLPVNRATILVFAPFSIVIVRSSSLQASES